MRVYVCDGVYERERERRDYVYITTCFRRMWLKEVTLCKVLWKYDLLMEREDGVTQRCWATSFQEILKERYLTDSHLPWGRGKDCTVKGFYLRNFLMDQKIKNVERGPQSKSTESARAWGVWMLTSVQYVSAQSAPSFPLACPVVDWPPTARPNKSFFCPHFPQHTQMQSKQLDQSF